MKLQNTSLWNTCESCRSPCLPIEQPILWKSKRNKYGWYYANMTAVILPMYLVHIPRKEVFMLERFRIVYHINMKWYVEQLDGYPASARSPCSLFLRYIFVAWFALTSLCVLIRLMQVAYYFCCWNCSVLLNLCPLTFLFTFHVSFPWSPSWHWHYNWPQLTMN